MDNMGDNKGGSTAAVILIDIDTLLNGVERWRMLPSPLATVINDG